VADAGSDNGEAEARTAPDARAVHEAILREGSSEIERPFSALAWSGLAAGLSMGFSLITEGLLRARLPDEPWRPIVADLGYTVGFLFVVLGRQQLFTENTLTAVLPFLQRPAARTLAKVALLWTAVLASNLVGALVLASVLAFSAAVDVEAQAAFADIGAEAMRGDFAVVVVRAIFGGWLIALMVWLLPYSGAARPLVIIIVTYIIALGGFAHVIAGSVETFYAAASGALGWAEVVVGYIIPSLIGNIVGGVALVAVLNHAQVAAGEGRRAGR